MTEVQWAEVILLATALIEVDLGLKSLFERLGLAESGFKARHYWVARALLYPATLAALVFAVFGANRQTLGLILVATIFAATDRLFWGIQEAVCPLLGLRLRLLQLGQPLLLIAVAVLAVTRGDFHWTAFVRACWGVVTTLPGASQWDPYKMVWYAAGFTWLLQPTNFLIRWFLNKDDDRFLVEAPSRSLGGPRAHAEQAAAANGAVAVNQTSSDVLRAGRTIGALERLLLLLLVLKSEFGALGLVLTAKSMARYSGIQRKIMTAEYYLLGTLLSTFSALAVGLILSAVQKG